MERLGEGGPVLGLLPGAIYSAGVIQIENGDGLIVYSDGINEAANAKDEELGDARLEQIISGNADAAPESLCEQILEQVTTFAGSGNPQDDRTLLVVKFSQSKTASPDWESGETHGRSGLVASAKVNTRC
jgi:serine phosphatase RsbU (regulator of sigma subunit)